FYPSLTLTTNFGYASENLSRLFDAGSRQYSFGPLGFSLPLFDGGRNRDNLQLAKARYDEAAANHQQRLLTALREVDDALSDLRQRALQAEAQAAAGRAAARALEVANRRFESGVSNYLDVTEAQRAALAAERAAVQIRTQRLLAAAAVARALGGGWQAGK
ncbi:MAG TPA: TolC family protein, partial [Burkholderiaceae bacterium]